MGGWAWRCCWQKLEKSDDLSVQGIVLIAPAVDMTADLMLGQDVGTRSGSG